jgi:SAM-dependent methyltransferase
MSNEPVWPRILTGERGLKSLGRRVTDGMSTTSVGNLVHWQLDEQSAAAYEQYLVPLLFEPAAGFLLELAEVAEGDRVLDVACGTGIVARKAAARVGSGGRVVGLDRNAGMLEVARRAAAEAAPQIEWRQDDAASLPFDDASFDAVLCQQGLQFFTDRAGAVSEMHRVTVPGGRIALSVLRSLEHNPGYARLAEVLEDHLGPDAATAMRSPFPSLSRHELKDLVAGAGFRDVEVLIGGGPVRYPSATELVGQEAASSPFAAEFEALDRGTRARLVAELERALEPYTDDRGVVFLAATYLVRGRR